MGMKLYSPAKVNLTLAVSGCREDGYHELDSVVTPLSLCDEVVLTRATAGESTLEMTSDSVDLSLIPADCEQNLAVRAVRLLEREVGRMLPTSIKIFKRIPLGGGLGGGSSNAATVLKGVNELWELRVSLERLCALGAQLGSDVPLFLLDGTVRMQGRGEVVQRLALPHATPLFMVLANAGVHCSTPRVYRALDEQREKAQNFFFKDLTERDVFCNNLHLSLQKGEAKAVLPWLLNDLEQPCYTLFPEVRGTAEALLQAGCEGVLLCGSGGTVCGIVTSAEAGERVLAHPALTQCWRASVQTLPDGVMAAHGPLTPIVMVRIHVGQPCPSASDLKN